MMSLGEFLHWKFVQIEKLHFDWDPYEGKTLISKFLGEIFEKMRLERVLMCVPIAIPHVMNSLGQFLHWMFVEIEKLRFDWDPYEGKTLISKFLGEIFEKMMLERVLTCVPIEMPHLMTSEGHFLHSKLVEIEKLHFHSYNFPGKELNLKTPGSNFNFSWYPKNK